MDQSGGRDESDRQALLAGRQPQSKSNVGLPRAAVADRNRVHSADDVRTAGNLEYAMSLSSEGIAANSKLTRL